MGRNGPSALPLGSCRAGASGEPQRALRRPPPGLFAYGLAPLPRGPADLERDGLGTSSFVLLSPDMETIGIRELQQRAAFALRRVRRGETLGITYRGPLVAVLAPPQLATGTASLIAAGRVTPARGSNRPLPEPVVASRPTQEVLDELRS